jgi:uncharacterized alpha-E superfamily protein
LGRVCAELGYQTIEDIIDVGLHEFLDRLQLSINSIGNKIGTTFFAVND